MAQCGDLGIMDDLHTDGKWKVVRLEKIDTESDVADKNEHIADQEQSTMFFGNWVN